MQEIIAQLDLGWWQWAAAAVCGVLVGFSKTGIGGMGIVIVPLMAMIFPPQKSSGVLLPMLVMADVFAVSHYHRHAVWEHLWRPMPWAVGGVVTAFFAMKYIPWSDQGYARLIGCIVLFCIALKAFKKTTKKVAEDAPAAAELHPLIIAGIGVLAGFSTMAANAAGPIWVIYLLAVGLPKYELVGTGAWFFMMLNLFKLPFQVNLGNITVQSLAFDLLMLPAIAVGALIGVRVLKRINQDIFNRIILWLAFAAAVKLII